MDIKKVITKKVGVYGKTSGSIQKTSKKTRLSKERSKKKETVYQKVSRGNHTRSITPWSSRR